MKIKTVVISTLIIGALAAAGIVFLSGADSENVSETTATEQPGKRKPPFLVRVVSATRANISETLELTGSVEPYRVARLASPAEGPVVHVGVREAERVKADEALLSIGRSKGVDALIVSLREELKKEADNLDRTRQLVESQALPGEHLDQARAAYEKVRATLVKAEETARDYTIKAPWAGVVSGVKVKEGEFVAPRELLLEMYDPDSLLIRASIPEKHAAGVAVGMDVEVRLDAYPDGVFQGRIERVYPFLDSRLRTRTVEIMLDQSVDLLPGMFARLTLSLQKVEAAVVVPLEAVVVTPKGPVVFVFDNGKAMAQTVRTGIESDNRIAVISGIQPGDMVVVAGNEKLKNGADVRLAGDEQPDAGKDRPLTELPVGQPGRPGDGR